MNGYYETSVSSTICARALNPYLRAPSCYSEYCCWEDTLCEDVSAGLTTHDDDFLELNYGCLSGYIFVWID